ncbi:SPOSA6832_04772, partial [Sporobolomyces salmonicolor]
MRRQAGQSSLRAWLGSWSLAVRSGAARTARASQGRSPGRQGLRAGELDRGTRRDEDEIDLSHIPKAELPDIMQEIDLLKNLHHPNIVQYRGYARTDSALYIVLEYCENGSLSAIIKKFGRFPESLVALYTLQVLQGLQYLHDEGVIHRDIKGSNILATKEGSIKLADFGVATRVGGPSDSAVVGSPYWMAPEVVDQTGATTASDIWSLGALVIELLTGKPPYHFLDPMPALFRIVNDDCPPLPEGASAVVRDFLAQCFQKDGNLRIGARKLLRHPWMVAAKRQAEITSRERQPRAARSMSLYDDTVQKQGDAHARERAAAPTTSNARSPRLPSSSNENRSPQLRQLHRRPSAELASALAPPFKSLPPTLAPAAKRRQSNAGLPLAIIQDQGSVGGEGEAEEGDNWDSDFEEGISISKIAALDRDSSDSSAPSDEDAESNSATIRPAKKTASVGATTKDKEGMAPILEDYSDLVDDDERDPFEGKVASLREKTRSGKLLLHPKDLSPSFAPSSFSSVRPSSPSQNQNPPSRPPSRTGSSIDKYSEADVDDYSDVFGRTLKSRLESLKLNTRLSNKSWLGDEDSDEEDPFAFVDSDPLSSSAEAEVYDDLETNLARDQAARQCALVSELIDVLAGGRGGGVDDWETREAALQLTGLLEESEDAKTHFVRSHGMLVVVEALQVARSREILSILLRIVNLIVGSDAGTLEKIALVGGCPVVMSFASKRYSREIRLEAALFIGSMCRTSLLTAEETEERRQLQMFVSCRGLRTLVDMMDESYNEGKDLVWMAVDGVSRVFEMHGPTPRNDFCRILSQEGLLEPLSSALLSVCTDDDDLAESAKFKIMNVLLLFAQSDHKVKEAMASRATVLRLIKAAGLLQPDLLALLLKTIKNLSMIPAALDVLQNANTIEVLVGILGRDFRGRLGAEIQNHAVNTLFNLCRLSKVRQEEAASAGAIPLLQRIVRDNSPLKQFALPILCDFAHAGKACRKLLWLHDGVAFYLNLLKDTFWVNPALEAVLAWLQDEPARVEDCLLAPTAVESLVRLFCKTKSTTFENLLEPFHKILRASSTVASRLATQSGFVKRITERLATFPSKKAVVRLNLLRITKTIFDSLLDRRDKDKVVMILAGPVAKLANEDKAVLSRQLAKALAGEFAAVKEDAKRSLAQRAMRRGASEGATPVGPPLSTDAATRRFLGSGLFSPPSTSPRRAPLPDFAAPPRRSATPR